MLNTTFNLLKLAGACGQQVGCNQGYDKLAQYLGGTTKYGKNTPIPLTTILDSNGLDDTLWCLRAVLSGEEARRDREARLLTCDYAEHVLHPYEAKYPDDLRPRQAIETARRYAVGEATTEELAAARDAAGAGEAAAARAGARDAARAAAGAGEAAAARAGARDAARAAARAAAGDAAGAWAMAWAAARAAAGDAAGAGAMAWAAAREWQTQRLRERLEVS